VVGEIYDEDDDEENEMDSRDISRNADGTFQMTGTAELDNVCEALGIEFQEEDMEVYVCYYVYIHIHRYKCTYMYMQLNVCIHIH
jgi:Mg2+/Co2+ transporter CorC